MAHQLWESVVCARPGRYLAWPGLARDGDTLAVVFSGDRAAHVCPWGRILLTRSRDGGRSWDPPARVVDTPLDDRDPGLVVTPRGMWLLTWSTSLAFADPAHQAGYPPATTDLWRRRAAALPPGTVRKWWGSWLVRSDDGGHTWSEPNRLGVRSPHGPAVGADGRLVHLGLPGPGAAEPACIRAEESRDDGRSWRPIGRVPLTGVDPAAVHEPHAVWTGDGGLTGLIRHQPPDPAAHRLLVTRSTDGGQVWSPVRDTGVWGYPPHLLAVSDGRLLAVYGHRRPPWGIRAVVSRDGGRTWAPRAGWALAAAADGDCGYPVTVERPDGVLVTVFYRSAGGGAPPAVHAVAWRLPP